MHSTSLSKDTREAVTRAGWDVKQGEQLFENYGQPNHNYMSNHGFAIQKYV